MPSQSAKVTRKEQSEPGFGFTQYIKMMTKDVS